MNEPIDLLQILEGAAAEIRTLRQRVESNKLMLDNITLRLALKQLCNGPVTYDNNSGLWHPLLLLLNQGRLSISSSAEIFLDAKLLTPELLKTL